MKLSESKLRKIIRKAILENVSQFTPEQQDLLDREVEMLGSYQRRLEQFPGWRSNSDKEFLQNVYFILQALVEGQYTVDDFQSWVGKRWPNYTVPMYQYLLDTVFEEKPY